MATPTLADRQTKTMLTLNYSLAMAAIDGINKSIRSFLLQGSSGYQPSAFTAAEEHKLMRGIAHLLKEVATARTNKDQPS